MDLLDFNYFSEDVFCNAFDLNDDFNIQNSGFQFSNEFDFLKPLNKENNLFSHDFKFFDIKYETKEIEKDSSQQQIQLVEKQKNDFQPSTFSSSKNPSSFRENSVCELTKNINFKTVLYHKRGRKQIVEKVKKNFHGSGDFDNIQRKIQVYFFNFLINLANDIIKSLLGKKSKYCFKDVKYEYKKVVNHNYAEKLKLYKYSDILQMKVSSKNRNFGENANKETYLEICKINPLFQKIFDKNYLYIFRKYFCEIKNGQKIIDFEGFIIELSPLTKGLSFLLSKNFDLKKKFIDVVNNIYFSYNSNHSNNNESVNSNLFVIISN